MRRYRSRSRRMSRSRSRSRRRKSRWRRRSRRRRSRRSRRRRRGRRSSEGPSGARGQESPLMEGTRLDSASCILTLGPSILLLHSPPVGAAHCAVQCSANFVLSTINKTGIFN